MPYDELLQQAEQCFWHGQFSEALQLLEQLDTQKAVTDLELLQGQLLRCRIFAYQDVKKAQRIAEQIFQLSQDLNHSLIQVDTCLILAEAWLELGMIETSKHYVDRGKVVLTTILDATASDLTEREAAILAQEGAYFTYKGEPQRAIEIIQQSLALRKQLELPHAIVQSLTYLGRAYTYQGEYDHALEVLQQSVTLLKQLEYPQGMALALLHLGRTYGNKNDPQMLDVMQNCFEIRERLSDSHGMAYTLCWMGWTYINTGQWNEAIPLLRQSLTLCEQLDIPGTFAEEKASQYLGFLYRQKGELDQALDYFQTSITIFEKTRERTSEGGITLAMTGIAYLQKGDLESALECARKSLKVNERRENEQYIVFSLTCLVIISLERDDLEAARRYVQRLLDLKQTVLEKGGTLLFSGIALSQALLLKRSPRTRDKIQAQLLFQQIVEDDEIYFFDWTVWASLHLCELLFFEFKTSEDPAILREIQMNVNRLLELAKTQHAYSILAETYLLQAKLALLEVNISQTRHLITQAQALAEEKGLHRLARRISHEHDTLLTQLPQWEALQAQEASFAETSKLAGIEEELTRMVQQRAVEPPELRSEAPVLLLILTESGLSLFSETFTLRSQLDPQLIGGLVTAINNFGKDAFVGSAGIDRIMYHGYKVAVKPLEPLLVCYVFQGDSYLALQKLDHFLTRVQAMPDLHHALTTELPADLRSKALGSLDPGVISGLQQLTTEIFTAVHKSGGDL